MKNRVTGILLLLTALVTSCQTDDKAEVTPANTSVTSRLIGTDSIATGSFLGIPVHAEASLAYQAIQELQSKGVSYLNIVGNVSSDLEQLHNRIPLYSYILLDRNQGTDSGIQITLESGKVKSIYLNSGAKLTQWPSNSRPESSVRLGDNSGDLYEKFVRIKAQSSYGNKFERIMLLTKDISSSYDRVMAQSPQWYFVNKTGSLWDQIQVYLKDGRVNYIKVSHYKD
ncbi:hypothetical protein DYBT9275_02382 [Dyadobacter sp. CECT 9275]|uniref:Uncharacterized protein n=1 Tax=Dyadobacter helix TaxID=2822344 RepID=A0A916JAQ6_9BACT|nr:hypothetical protein [Dyadobacter sp. CECT 9275]CAG5000086.1 hypothetical protein DYBT9275_02382 [Dyadobacter sp. CECT 9275]